MNNYKELIVWQKSMDVVEKIYQLTRSFPSEERFGLITQIRRAAISVLSNIAEGSGRNSDKEFRNYLGIANGSSNELTTQLLIAVRIGYLKEDDCSEIFEMINEIKKMNYTLIKKLSNV